MYLEPITKREMFGAFITVAALIAVLILISRQKDSDTTVIKEHDHEVTVIVEDPSGKKTTTITKDTTRKSKEVVKTIVKPKVNVSALAGVSTTDSRKPVYGISVSKEFIGPITLGAFGLTNGIIGISVGVNF
jgi:hypothetical protein